MKDPGALVGDALRKINADFDLRDLLGELLASVLEATASARAIAAVWTESSGLIAVAANGTPAPLSPQEELDTLRPLIEMTARTGRIVFTDDAAKDDRFRDAAHRSGMHIRRLGAAPIFSRGRAIGGIVYYGDAPGALTRPATEILAEAAHCSAMALEVSHLREERPIDPATGLMTYRSFLGRLNDEIARATRYGRTFTVLRVSCREEPRTAAAAIFRHLRPADLLTRSERGEFLAILPETPKIEASQVARAITESLPVTLGMVSVPEDAVAAETLLMALEGRATIESAAAAEAVLASREGRALEAALRVLLGADLELKTQLDAAGSLIAAAVGAGGVAVMVPGVHEPEAEGRDVPFGFGSLRVKGSVGEYETQLLQALGKRLDQALAGSAEMQKRREESRARQEALAKAVEELRRKYEFSAIVGTGPALTQVLQIVARAAETDAPVLITGESGTGKELIARAVHANSARRKNGFTILNCAAVPPSLIESELFGHTKGAYTSASEDRKGLFETANRGTIFLDEIAEIPVEVQAKLLRALQFGEIQRVGSDELVHADVRVVAATNRDLQEDVRRKRFREDLYYRINVFRIHVPPLREHPEDIPALIEHFCRKFAAEFKRGDIRPDPEVIETLRTYSYPGNVRELENVILRAIAMASGSTLTPKDLPPDLLGGSAPTGFIIPRTGEELESLKKSATREVSDRLERAFVDYALGQTRGNVSEAARRTGIDRSWLQKLVTKHRK